MKINTSAFKKSLLAIFAVMFTTTVVATGGNGNEPQKKQEDAQAQFCEKYPLVCGIFTSGTGGNGNEPDD